MEFSVPKAMLCLVNAILSPEAPKRCLSFFNFLQVILYIGPEGECFRDGSIYVCKCHVLDSGRCFTLTSAGKKFCPNCYQNTLTPHVTARQRVVQFVNQPVGGTTAANTTQKSECDQLITKFTLTRRSAQEAATTSDYIVKLGADKRRLMEAVDSLAGMREAMDNAPG